ncbi:MAG TPA: PfkB family carbohydrate kinase [Candidatus Cloacimonadota bacterium]|nr:PfkB family carbohydrate kinase [Candidatus Cloacimonadota bacterium]
MSLVIVGSIGLDTIETPKGKVTDALGGSAVYGSLAASYFTRVHTVGVVGSDFPNEHIELLKRHGIEVDGLEIREGNTFRWSGKYEDWNQAQTLDTQLNVFGDFNPILPQDCLHCQTILLGNIHPDLQLQVLKQIKNYRIVACDTMNYWINGTRERLQEVIKRVDIVFINEEELKLYTNEQNVFQAADLVLAQGPKLLVLKRGEYGSVLIGKEFLFFAPAYPVREVKDPTGAGDSFAGGFMGYMDQAGEFTPKNLKEAVLYGTVMAALNVSEFSVEKLTDHSLEHIQKMQTELKSWMQV